MMYGTLNRAHTLLLIIDFLCIIYEICPENLENIELADQAAEALRSAVHSYRIHERNDMTRCHLVGAAGFQDGNGKLLIAHSTHKHGLLPKRATHVSHIGPDSRRHIRRIHQGGECRPLCFIIVTAEAWTARSFAFSLHNVRRSAISGRDAIY